LDNFIKYYEEFKDSPIKETLILFLVMIIQFFHNLFIFATIEKTTSFHFLIIEIIGELSPYIKKLIDKKMNITIYIIIIIGLCFILFMTLVFNEIIILECFGLQKNTKKFISSRAEMERLNKSEYCGKFDSISTEEERDIENFVDNNNALNK
jgi:hypothetical protein